jgi:tRNA A37 threonylcarbamoyladenosine dehydratase
MWCAIIQAFNNALMGRVAVKNTLVLFGAGHIGSAIARGMLRTGNSDLRIIDPDLMIWGPERGCGKRRRRRTCVG